MSPILLARALRRHGWAYSRRGKGLAAFGTRFPNGKGFTEILDLTMVRSLDMAPAQVAELLTKQAAFSVGFDLRAPLVPA